MIKLLKENHVKYRKLISTANNPGKLSYVDSYYFLKNVFLCIPSMLTHSQKKKEKEKKTGKQPRSISDAKSEG